MKRRFEPVASQRLDKIEREKIYKQHMRKVGRVKCAVDCTQPELSPRHRIIAQQAEQRRVDHLKQTRAKIRASTKESKVPSFTDPTSRPLSSRSTSSRAADPYAGTLFPSPAPFVMPTESHFLTTYRNQLAKSRSIDTRRRSEEKNESDSDDQILDVESSDSILSSDASSESESFGV